MALWLGTSPLILASQSSTRKMLLANAGLPFEAIPADIDERAVQAGSQVTSPLEIASLLANEKAMAVSRNHRGRYVVGADQTLALGQRLFNKPVDRIQAMQQLRDLSGHTHELHSAVQLVYNGQSIFGVVSTARMTMRSLTESQIEAYLNEAGDSVMSSVGAYQLEGVGVHLFEDIEGDHFTILGLPLLPLLVGLRSEQLIAV